MAGDWRPNPNWHNGTLKPVSDAAHAAGMKFLVWVEPCRAIHGRPITLEHPEYFLTGNADGKIRDGQTLLLDLGKPEALKWAIDVVAGLVEDYGIDWYEEDFNIEPNPYLETAAEPNRWGMNEMRFIEGHFAFWDALLQAIPEPGDSQLRQRRTANRPGIDLARATSLAERLQLLSRSDRRVDAGSQLRNSPLAPDSREHDSRLVDLRHV